MILLFRLSFLSSFVTIISSPNSLAGTEGGIGGIQDPLCANRVDRKAARPAVKVLVIFQKTLCTVVDSHNQK